uniref:AAA+ ATPase domain-containing protein n=1 Tax=Cannabis sativa TaxID=3483 RepID=A0A803QM51_CANSA
MLMESKESLAQLGSYLGGLMFLWAIFQQFFPNQLRNYLEKYSQRLASHLYPYIQIRFNELTGERLMRSEAYSAIENYLSTNSSLHAKRLKADVVKSNNQSLVLSMDDHEEVVDEFKGVKLWWASGKNNSKTQTVSFYQVSDERRYYILTFHKRHRELIVGAYLNHVLKEGKAIKVRNRQRKLYTNHGSYWSHVVFQHPATFQTLALEQEKKQDIIDDLIAFSQAEEFYARIGRAWKRGYLLYGPPGTGKSTMISAMANLLNYDIYDLELTAVRDNTDLRRLLIETSTCGGERIIVFTTNYVEKLDPALIRKGRMDKHIELSYCGFEAFKVLAKNYLCIEDHPLFSTIGKLLGEAKITPAEVAEHLMPKKIVSGQAEISLKSLIQGLEKAKQDEKLKAEEEEAKKKALDDKNEDKHQESKCDLKSNGY